MNINLVRFPLFILASMAPSFSVSLQAFTVYDGAHYSGIA